MARPKGSQNKITTAAKEAFQHAFNRLGGVDDLVKWGKDNRTEFYKIYSKLIPSDVNANLNGNVKIDGTINFIRPDNKL